MYDIISKGIFVIHKLSTCCSTRVLYRQERFRCFRRKEIYYTNLYWYTKRDLRVRDFAAL